MKYYCKQLEASRGKKWNWQAQNSQQTVVKHCTEATSISLKVKQQAQVGNKFNKGGVKTRQS
jgi:hypothetical protein